MTDMRYIGMLEEETPEGIMVVKASQQKVEIRHGDYTGKVFFVTREIFIKPPTLTLLN